MVYAQNLTTRPAPLFQVIVNILLFAMLHSFSMGNPREQQRCTPKKDYQPEVTAADLTEKVNGHLSSLIDAINTGDTEQFTNYLAFSSRFHRYSRRNQELIYDQKPEATRVASYGKWKKEGYQVAAGQNGIRILYPKHPKGLKREVTPDPDDEATT